MARIGPERKRAIAERVSDPPEDGGARRVAIGCGIAAVIAVLGVGALGLAGSAWTRFGAPALAAGEPSVDPAAGTGPGTGPATAHPGPGGSAPGPPRSPLEDMRHRYAPGPHVRLEGMIPSPVPLGRTPAPTAWASGRSADTPWIVHGARYEPGPPPSPAPLFAPRCAHAPGEPVDRALTILAGVPAQARVRAEDAGGGTAVTAYAVAFDGYRGHFVLPATVPTELGIVSAGGSDGATVRFTMGAPVRPDGSVATSGDPFPVTVRIAAIDDMQRVSEWVVRPLSVLPVGTGDVEVALTMSEATDLDLYVTDPTGTTVYFGNTTGVTGGRLDLDANAACSGNLGMNNEHIYWERGHAPRGTYTVRVAHFESCVEGRPVDYRITVRNCGETVVLAGRFVGQGRSESCLSGGQDPSFCQDVVSFVAPPCRIAN